jgi:hypothetical protein
VGKARLAAVPTVREYRPFCFVKGSRDFGLTQWVAPPVGSFFAGSLSLSRCRATFRLGAKFCRKLKRSPSPSAFQRGSRET